MTWFSNSALMFSTLLVVILFVGIIAVFPNLFSLHEMLFQIIAVLLAVWCTAVVTNQLLTGQSSKEEAREKNIKVHENKIAVYADFVSKMWATLNDGQVEPDEMVSVRAEVFNRLIFYLKDLQVREISASFEKLEKDSSPDMYVEVFQEITKVLRNDVLERDSESKTGDIQTLWNRFNKFLPEPVEETPAPAIEVKEEAQAIFEPVVEVPIIESKHIKSPCFHFNILSTEWQYEIFSNGAQALALCEYGESWRTNLIKRCGYNDVVFLYKTGGPGYVGAFLAKGWIVFEADGQGKLTKIVESIFEESGKKTAPVEESEWQKKVDLYDAQDYIDDGCTLISYLLVDPLVYYAGGVGCISVYRRTIAAYDSGDAWKTLARFKSILDTEPKEDVNCYTYENQVNRIQTNEDALKKLIADNNIVSSKWDSKVGWIDQ